MNTLNKYICLYVYIYIYIYDLYKQRPYGQRNRGNGFLKPNPVLRTWGKGFLEPGQRVLRTKPSS